MKNKRYYILGAGLAALSFVLLKKSNVLNLLFNPQPTLDDRLRRAMEEGLDKDTFQIVSEFREMVKSGKIGPEQARGYLRGIIPIGTMQSGLVESQPYSGLRIEDDGFVYLK